MSNIRILIIEDEPLIAEDIASYLSDIDFDIAGIAHDSETALDYLALRNPDAVLLDIQIKGSKDGIDLAKIINEKYDLPFVYLTSHSDKGTIERAKVTMPYGYILKPFDERDLITSLEMAVYRHAQQHRGNNISLNDVNQQLETPLTQKEFEILEDVSLGMTNKQMAEKHFVSVNTIKTHLKKVYQKLDVHNRSSAIAKLRN